MVKISLVGDIFPANSTYTKRYGYGSLSVNNTGESWEKNLYGMFKDSDIVFGNLEVPLIDDPQIVDNNAFVGSKEFAIILKKLGFDVLSIANNHILGYGSGGLKSTLNALSNECISYAGVYDDKKSNIAIIKKDNIKFGFAAFNAIQDLHNPDLLADLTLENIKKTLDEMKALNLDFKLLSFHWGNEYSNIPSFDQIRLARDIINYGADIVIGHHPHVIQPVERYKHGIIIYSLGNFIFDFPFSNQFKTGMLVELNIEAGRKIESVISGIRLHQEKINYIDLSSQFRRKLNRYTVNLSRLSGKTRNDYMKHYNKKLAVNHFWQRVLMKRKLLILLFFSNHRKQILKNIYDRFTTNG